MSSGTTADAHDRAQAKSAAKASRHIRPSRAAGVRTAYFEPR
jgi:hypothetical protein